MKMLAVFSIKGQEIMISDSFVSHEWDITPGISFFIDLDDEDDLDALSKSLGSKGKFTCLRTIMAFRNDSLGLRTTLV